MKYSCPYCSKSLEGKGDLMEASLHNDIKQVTCIYCSKTIQIKPYLGYKFACKALLLAPTALFIKLFFSDKQISAELWLANAALAIICSFIWWPLYLKQKNAPFYEEPRFNR